MAKKKQQLVVEILTDKDWDEHIKFRDGLVFADIYSDAFGPSAGVLLRTKQYKVEHPQGELLTLAAINADTVELVKRLQGHSEPTFMFLVNGLMVNMYIGCNAPVLIRLLDDEFSRELDVRRGIGRRKFLPFDKPTQAEIERNKRSDESIYADRRAEEERREAEIRQIRERAYDQIAPALKATTVVVFLPPSVEGDSLPEIAEPLKEKWAKMGMEIVRENSLIINEEMANEMFYERKLPQHKELVEILKTGNSIAILLKKVRPGEGEEDKGGQGDAPPPGEEEDEAVGDTYPIDIGIIEKSVAQTVYGFYPDDGESDIEEEQEEEQMPQSAEESTDEEEYDMEEDEGEYWGEGKPPATKVSSMVLYAYQPKEMRPPVHSPAAQLIRRLSDGVKIPGIYTPFTPYSKCAAVRVLFPTIAAPYYEMEELPEEPPPSVVMVFDVAKRDEVMEISAELTRDITKIAFFNDKKERLVDTLEDYNMLKRSGARDKLALSVVRITSAPLLALAAAGPIYVSPNKRVAKYDDHVYFGVENVADPHRAETPPEVEEEMEELSPLPQTRQAPVAVSEGGENEEEEVEEEENGAPAEEQPPTRTQSNVPPTRTQSNVPPTRTQSNVPPTRTQSNVPPTRTQSDVLSAE